MKIYPHDGDLDSRAPYPADAGRDLHAGAPDETPPAYEVWAAEWEAQRAPIVAALTAGGHLESRYVGPTVHTPVSAPHEGPLYTPGWMLDEDTGDVLVRHWDAATAPPHWDPAVLAAYAATLSRAGFVVTPIPAHGVHPPYLRVNPQPYTVTPSYANPDFAFYVVQAPDEPAVTVSWDPAWQATPYVCLAHPLAGTPGTPACAHIQAVAAYRAAQEGGAE